MTGCTYKYPNMEAERARNNMSKQALADYLGTTPNTYRNWQAGRTPLPLAKLQAMAKLFQVSEDYLLGGVTNAAG